MSKVSGVNVCSVTAIERSGGEVDGELVLLGEVERLDGLPEALRDRRRCEHEPGTSPWPPYSIPLRSPCSCFVGIPVDGPERITLQMTSGVSEVAMSPNVSVIRSIPGPDVAVIDRAPPARRRRAPC